MREILWPMIAIFFLLSIGSCRSISKSDALPKRQPSAAYTPMTNSPSPSLDQLIQAATKAEVPTIETALEQLHQDFPGFFDRSALLYHSRSIQPSTFDQPRALVYGYDAKLVVAFTGPNATNESKTLEVMTFNEPQGFEFREIAFLNNGAHPMDPDDLDPKYSTKSVSVSVANPVKCMDCHGYWTTEPIYDTYFIWPGAYGSQDDEVFDPVKDVHDRAFLTSKNHVEKNHFDAFMTATSNDPRYKYLLPELRFHTDYGNSHSANEELTSRLVAMIAETIADGLVGNPKVWPYRYALAHIFGCERVAIDQYSKEFRLASLDEVVGQIQGLLPKQVYAFHEAKAGHLPEVMKSSMRTRIKYYLDKNKRMDEALGEHLAWTPLNSDARMALDKLKQETALIHSLAKVTDSEAAFLVLNTNVSFDKVPGALEFIFKPLGVDTGSWGLSKERVLDFGEGEQNTTILYAPFVRRVGQREKLSVWDDALKNQPMGDVCDELKKLSLKTLTQ